MRNNLMKPRFIGLVFILLGFLSLLYFLAAVTFKVASSRFFLLASIPLILTGIYKRFFMKPIKSKIMRLLIRILHIGILFGFTVFILIEVLILSSAFEKNTGKPDYIVVLGAGLRGETPSLILSQRLDAAVKLIHANPGTKVIVSGGQGPGETTTEANAMKKALIEKGIPEALITKEEKSTSTLENICYTRDIIKKTDNRDKLTITIVTNSFHMFRAKFLAARVGFKAQGYTAKTFAPLIPAYYIRESMAIVKSFILDKPNKVAPVEIGEKIDSYKGVAVYNNGADYSKNYGKNFSPDGYYYGYQWQCVEFIKRFFYQAKSHKMPDVYGNAKDFFDSKVKQGELNKGRGLHQYRNGENVEPQADDLLVFTDTTYGHVAIITEVGKDYIEVIQQNIYNTPRQKFMLTEKDGKYFITEPRKPAGWLRKE